MSEPVQKTLDTSRRVVGVMARVSNSAPVTIGDLWRRFHGEEIRDRLVRRGDDVYSVYFDYESDERGEFGMLVGYEVDRDAEVPRAMSEVMVRPGRYEVFDATGPQPDTVQKVWSAIWGMSLQRAYETDFDCYGASGSVKIYVGVL